MIFRLVLLSGVFFAPAAYAQQITAPETPRHEPAPLNDLNARKTEPLEVPPGKLCLIEAPKPCGDKAEVIQKPYTGDGALYYLERPPKPERESPAASLKPPSN